MLTHVYYILVTSYLFLFDLNYSSYLGKIVKISKGKHRYEHYLLVRNIDGSGPILQCSYFDFNNKLESMAIGKYEITNLSYS